MSLASYSDLKASIGDWLNRADLTAAIPDFISLAEAQMNRRFVAEGPVRQMVARADATISTEFGTVPDDFMGTRAFYMNATPTLQLIYCEPEQILQRKAQTTQLTGCPRYFSVVGGEFQFFPAPSQAYSAELTFYQRIPALSVSNTTNWLLTLHPDAYLYGALAQSAPYLKDDARLAGWVQIYQAILSDIIQSNKIERTAPFLAVPDVAGTTP